MYVKGISCAKGTAKKFHLFFTLFWQGCSSNGDLFIFKTPNRFWPATDLRGSDCGFRAEVQLPHPRVKYVVGVKWVIRVKSFVGMNWVVGLKWYFTSKLRS